MSEVDHPAHYKGYQVEVECIDIVRHLPFDLGNAVKYIWRAGKKGNNKMDEDLHKARWYLRDWQANFNERPAPDLSTANSVFKLIPTGSMQPDMRKIIGRILACDIVEATYMLDQYIMELSAAALGVNLVNDMSERNFMFTIGEVFRYNGQTFYCTTSGTGIVQYIRVDEPSNDMLYRAPDGKLYQYLCDPERYGTSVCACESGKLTCDAIQQALFGRDCVEGEIWVPVDEGK